MKTEGLVEGGLFFPPLNKIVGNAQMVKDACDNGISDLLNSLRPSVEGGDCRDNGGSRFEKCDDVAGLDEVPRRFARDDDEFPFLFEENIGGAGDGAVGPAIGNASHGSHGTGDDDHGVESG